MASDQKNNVIVELYDLTLTDRKDDRFGRVITNKSLNEDDIIKMAVARRTDINPTTLRASMDLLKEVASEQIANGASVAFGLGYFNLGVNGVFIGDNDKWDSSRNSLSIRVTPTAALRKQVNAATVNVRGMASVGTAINSLTDVSSGEVNARLTPGGAVNLVGVKIKIAGENPDNGIALINQQTGETVKIPGNAIAINDPSKVTFIAPANLPAGDYKLSLTTQFSNSKQLINESRTSLFDYVLVVE